MSMHYKCNEGEVDYHVTDSSEAEGDTYSVPHQQEQPAAEVTCPASPEPESEPEPAPAASPPTQEPSDQEAEKPKRYLSLCTRVQRNRIAGRNQFSRRKVDLWQIQRAYRRSLEREGKKKKRAEKAKRDGEEKEEME